MDIWAHSDFILPFQLDSSGIRGRFIRLSTVIDAILAKHHYPPPVARLTAEAAVLAALLGSMLKMDGIFTLQAKGDGPISLLVADYTSEGAVRAYASFDSSKLATVPDSFNELLGGGYLAFTVDQGADFERYQGIVEINGASLSEAAQHYFWQSDQLRTAVKFYAAQSGGSWQAGVMALQAMPPVGGTSNKPPAGGSQTEPPENNAAGPDETGAHDLDIVPPGWDEAVILMNTIRAQEMLDPALPPEEVLYRLFHEGGVRAFDRQPLNHQCRCSYERAAMVVESLSPDQRTEMAVDGAITITCEFCSSVYRFEVGEL